VKEGGADAGLIIHEAQLTYNKTGFHRVIDMGKWWKDKFGLPLPLGANVLRRSLPDAIKSECCRMMRESIQYALDHHAEALEYALQFARDMEPRLAEKYVGMYVNHYTVDAGEEIPKAAQLLFDMGYEVGLIPTRMTVDFVR
jgi:1,4-dihydroxy-6-naphthoate synthase